MKERPIIFSGESVNAIFDGRKTQTRRAMKPQMDYLYPCGENDEPIPVCEVWGKDGVYVDPVKCPYGKPGDRLWVRRKKDLSFAWKKADAFLWLEIKNIRVERLQDISEEDATAEGVDYIPSAPAALTHRSSFAGLWDKINGKPRYVKGAGFGGETKKVESTVSWASNPYVWVIEFQKLEK